MNTAIIGLGNIGSRLATNLTAGGQSVIVADRTLAKAEEFAGKLGGKAKPMPIADAINKADVVILAIYFDAIKELVATYRSALAGKIIVDPSNPLAPDGKGGFKKAIPADQSSGQLIAALLPEGALSRHSARWVLSRWVLASTARRNARCCSMQRIFRKRAKPLLGSLRQAAFRLSAWAVSTNPFALKWAATFTSSESLASWYQPRKRRH